MRKRTWSVALGAVLGTAFALHSFVYACDHSTEATAPKAETEVTAPAAATVPNVTVDVAVPFESLKVRRVSFIATQSMVCDSTKPTATQTVKRTAKVAMTLGRALVTTVGAVVDSIVEAAAEKTAGLV